MVIARVVGVLVVVAACGGRPAPAPRLPPAGADNSPDGEGVDDGVGFLARASARLVTDGFGDGDGAPADRRGERGAYAGYAYGGGIYGGGAYGGSVYGGYTASATFTPVARPLDYAVHNLVDAGAVAGVVTWHRAPGERRLRSPCGDIDNPTLRLGPRGEAAGAVVYLDRIVKGRAPPVAKLGGIVEKHGCAFRPTVQTMVPVPATLTVHNDGSREVVVARGDSGEPAVVTLGPAGTRMLGVQRGVTAITDQAGRLAPAWIVAPGHPYVAITDAAGRFRLDEVVPGTYELVVWHPPIITGWRDGKPQYGAPIVTTRTVKVGAYATSKADVVLGRP